MKKIRQTYNNKGDAPEGRMVCPNWDTPEVNCKSNGRGRTSAGKVITLGIDYMLAPEIIQAATESLRCGYEVRICGETSKDEAIRLFPCATPDKTAMFVKAATLDDFRDKTLADKKMRLMRNGKETTPEEESARKEESSGDEVEEVTPDPIITCPKCGCRYRAHKKK